MTVDTLTEEQSMLLTREAGLAAMSICEGLTSLRKSDFVQHPYTFHAFFSVSIGMERLMKLIVISEHRLNNNNSFPDNAYLKRFGHQIVKLYTACKSIADRMGISHLYRDVENNPISKEIIFFLDDFADKARYYNLDSLTGLPQTTDDPLKRWHEKVNEPIIFYHYRKSRAAISLEQDLFNVEGIYVRFHDYSGESINSLQELLPKANTIEVSRKYSVLYTYKIIRFLSSLLYAIDYPRLYPYLSEYFSQLRYEDKYVLTKKTWSLYKL